MKRAELVALNRMVGAGDTRLECTDWLRDLRRVSRDAGLSAAPREPIPLPPLRCSAHDCSTWKASATWVCNVCENECVPLCTLCSFRQRSHCGSPVSASPTFPPSPSWVGASYPAG